MDGAYGDKDSFGSVGFEPAVEKREKRRPWKMSRLIFNRNRLAFFFLPNIKGTDILTPPPDTITLPSEYIDKSLP